jgi:glycolate oxidase FAD binding subunit
MQTEAITDPGLQVLRDVVRAAGADRTPLRLRGGGTRDFYGEAPAGELLDLSGHAGIVSYEPTELVITARCGTTITELETALVERRQFLPFEPPRFGAAATIGGMVASGLSGPRRATAGSVRDFMLGAVLMDATGELLHFGGQVMKNVAGYDVSRLLSGSMGILGPIVQVSLKVLPLPTTEATLRMPISLQEALPLLNRWAGQPLPISATAFANGELAVRLSGAPAAVDAAASRLQASHGVVTMAPAEASAYWCGLRDHTGAFFDGDTPLWRLSLPSTAPAFELSGPQLVEWGGALRWFRTDAAATVVRKLAQNAGGTATLFRSQDKSAGAFHPLAAVNFELHRRVKRALDPHQIFNPGRMYAGL